MGDGFRRGTLYALCALSGACALAYQVAWVRELTLILGVSAHAVSAVLAAFMGGLAAGSYAFGRLAAGARRPLALYGMLELGIAVSALALPLGFDALTGAYPAVYEALAERPAVFGAVRFAALAALLFPPCALMGGTIPVLSRLQSRSPQSFGRDVGLLYGLNTLGSVVGCLLAGFVLLAEFGLRATTRLAALGNLAIGVCSLLLARAASPASPAAAAGSAAPRARLRSFPRVVVAVFAISGFCSLGYEVLWTRTLVFYLHNSTYAFTAMLACFLLGIGLGSLVFAAAVDRARRPSLWLALTQLGIAALTVLSIRLYPHLPELAQLVQAATELDAWWKALAIQGLQASLALLPATLLMGLSFPVAVRLFARSVPSVSFDVGVLYAANTVAAIAGSLVAGFLLLPWLGLVDAFRLLVALNALAGLAVLLSSPELGAGLRAPAALAALGLPMLVGAAVPGDVFLRAFARQREILFYRDGVADTVMVKARGRELESRKLVFSDGRGAAGTFTNPDNRVSGHLPLLLHGRATEVLSIGFGVGNTLAAIAVHPEVERVDVAELSPNVIAAAPWFPTNDRVYEDPRVRLHVQDGRNFLLGLRRRYDVIQLEPPEIHTAAVVYLYTREFYELAKLRLKPGGLLCQWANVRMMPLREQKMLIRTFLEVFPEGTVWMPRQKLRYVLLIGGEAPFRVDYASLGRALAVDAVREDLERSSGIASPAELLASFRLSARAARAFCAGAPVITDDRTLVDFSVPRSVDANFGLSNAFGGLGVSALLPGGWPATRDYYVRNLEELRASVESVYPFLSGFESPEQAREVREQLALESRRFDRAMARRIEKMRVASVAIRGR